MPVLNSDSRHLAHEHWDWKHRRVREHWRQTWPACSNGRQPGCHRNKSPGHGSRRTAVQHDRATGAGCRRAGIELAGCPEPVASCRPDSAQRSWPRAVMITSDPALEQALSGMGMFTSPRVSLRRARGTTCLLGRGGSDTRRPISRPGCWRPGWKSGPTCQGFSAQIPGSFPRPGCCAA